SPNFFFNKKFENYFQKVNSISEELSLQLKGFDLVIEFCVFGSQVGANCKAINKTKTILIFDAPLDEQFEEMYGKMGKFRDNIVSSEIKSLHAADTIICYSNA